jgi:multidrug efflux pump subunit AcrA (membrane-fusion protein)
MSKTTDPTTLHDPYPPTDNPANGSPPHSLSAPPIGSNGHAARSVPGRSASRSSRRPYWLAGLIVIALGTAGGAWYFNRHNGERADVILYKVKKEQLNVSVTEKGTLESAANYDIICRVRAGNKNFATSIKWVIDDGTRIKPGQLLMELDDSALKEQEENQGNTVREKLSLKVKAEKDYEIQNKKNESAIALAQTALVNAEIELDKLTGLNVDPALVPRAAVAGIATALTEGGSFRQELDDLTGQISLAQSEVEQNSERAAWADRMVKLTYMSPAQAQAERSRLDSSQEKLRSLKDKKRLLMSHDRRQRLTTLTSTRDNARRALDEAILQAEANEIQFRIEKETKIAIFEQAKDTLEDIKKQRKECKIYAPEFIREGQMVVYFKNEGSGRFSSSPTGMIEHGAQVKEGQKMLRIPNLELMQVNTKIHEAMVSRIHGDVRVPTRIVEVMQVGMLTNTDLLGRTLAMHPEMIEQVRNNYRRYEYKKIADGQRATIRVESMPEKQFVGRVRSVSQVASQTDSWMSDVKLYQTYVLIDGELLPEGKVVPLEGERIKPDMTAEVTISVDASKEPVITAPIQSIIGGAEMGATRELFVRTGNGYERKTVTLGLYNDKMVEIRSGLAEGDEVVVNPKVLLGDTKTKTREVGDSKDKNGEHRDYEKPSEKPGGFDPTKGPGGFDPTKGGPGGFDPTKGGPGGFDPTKKKGKKGLGGQQMPPNVGE